MDDSWTALQRFSHVAGEGEVPMTFIRAPYIGEAGDRVEVLSQVDGRIVAACQGRQLALAFHAELTEDSRMYQFFLKMIQ